MSVLYERVLASGPLASVPTEELVCSAPHPERSCLSRLDGRRRQNIPACSVVMTSAVEPGQFVSTLAPRAQSQVLATQNALHLGERPWEWRGLSRQLRQTQPGSQAPQAAAQGVAGAGTRGAAHLTLGLCRPAAAQARPGQARVVPASRGCLCLGLTSASSELCDPGQVTKPL